MKSRSQQKKEATHEAILRVATDLVRAEGIAAASVARVMKGAGLTVGGFYAHFASKSHLAATALRRAFAENMGALFVGTEGASRTGRGKNLGIRSDLTSGAICHTVTYPGNHSPGPRRRVGRQVLATEER